MSETQNYKTVTLTRDEMRQVEFALDERIERLESLAAVGGEYYIEALARSVAARKLVVEA